MVQWFRKYSCDKGARTSDYIWGKVSMRQNVIGTFIVGRDKATSTRLENATIFAESLALLIRVAAENIDQNRSS